MYLYGSIFIITVALVVWTNDARMYVLSLSLSLFPFASASPSIFTFSLVRFSFLFSD
jgi:hypothetical protein